MEEVQASGATFRGFPLTFSSVHAKQWVTITRLPYGTPSGAIATALRPFGEPEIVRMDKCKGIPTGTHQALMSVSKPIPSRLRIQGHPCNIFYRGQVRTCYKCQRPGHISKDCPGNPKNDGDRASNTNTTSVPTSGTSVPSTSGAPIRSYADSAAARPHRTATTGPGIWAAPPAIVHVGTISPITDLLESITMGITAPTTGPGGSATVGAHTTGPTGADPHGGELTPSPVHYDDITDLAAPPADGSSSDDMVTPLVPKMGTVNVGDHLVLPQIVDLAALVDSLTAGLLDPVADSGDSATPLAQIKGAIVSPPDDTVTTPAPVDDSTKDSTVFVKPQLCAPRVKTTPEARVPGDSFSDNELSSSDTEEQRVQRRSKRKADPSSPATSVASPPRQKKKDDVEEVKDDMEAESGDPDQACDLPLPKTPTRSGSLDRLLLATPRQHALPRNRSLSPSDSFVPGRRRTSPSPPPTGKKTHSAALLITGGRYIVLPDQCDPGSPVITASGNLVPTPPPPTGGARRPDAHLSSSTEPPTPTFNV